MNQRTLFDAPEVIDPLTPEARADFTARHTPAVAPPRKLSIDERFRLWIRRNPLVYTAFCEEARRLRANGTNRIGAKQIMEMLRRGEGSVKAPEGGFNLNNDFTASLARMAMCEPDLDGAFELRTRKGASR